MSLVVAFIIESWREIILAAGEVDEKEADLIFGSDLEHSDPDLFVLAGEVSLSGAEISDPTNLKKSMKIGYYFPQEEGKEASGKPERQVDLNKVKVIRRVLNRWPAAVGHKWWYCIDERAPLVEEKHFNGGFLPPFNPGDITIYIDDLSSYGYASYILGGFDYNFCSPSYQEASWAPSVSISWGFLKD